MDVIYTSETPPNFYQTSLRHIPEDCILDNKPFYVQNQKSEQADTSRRHWSIGPFSAVSVHDVETNLPLLSGARALMGPHTGPHAAAAAAAVTVTSLPPLQPRAATTGGTDLVFPLQVQSVCKYNANLFIYARKNLNNYLPEDKRTNAGSHRSY
jgi:hypothetical protein